MEVYFEKQLRLSSSVTQLVQFVELTSDNEWIETIPLSEYSFVVKMTVHPNYEELKDMEYQGTLNNGIPVFRKIIQKENI